MKSSGITYKQLREKIAVYLGGKRVGTIRCVESHSSVLLGYAYFPTNGTRGGIFNSISAVKKSIES